MSKIEILMVPDLRSSVVKAVHLLEARCDVGLLLLDFPETLEIKLSKLADYETSYEELITMIRRERILPEPLESWTYLAEPILRALPRLRLVRPELEIRCHVPAEAPFSYSEDSLEIARLAYRAKATGKIDAEEWRHTIKRVLDRTRRFFDEAVSRILLGTPDHDAVCLAGLDAFRLKQRIGKYRRNVVVKTVEPFYHRTPLETLYSLLSGGDLSDDRLSTLALAYVEYLYQYVIRSRHRDEAYNRWVAEKNLRPKQATGSAQQMLDY
jgi:hypothetical protein